MGIRIFVNGGKSDSIYERHPTFARLMPFV
jgi:hypothetical protein